eukprot:INCI11311.1.p1 GENE.INCI11311.1~~INCI11311.1.p1  ORF type:complete len:395 (+),score=66.34 INCI11311.1:381-1565(+)
MPSYGSAGMRGDGSSSNTGNQISSRSSTRVAQQPGGNSSFSLGWGDPSNATKVVRQQPTYAPAPSGGSGGANVFGTGGSNAGYGGGGPGGYNNNNNSGGGVYGGGGQGGYGSGSYGGAPSNGSYAAAPVPGGGASGGGYPGGGGGSGFSSGDYLPKSLNTGPAGGPGLYRADSLESMAGPISTSPMTRMRDHQQEFGLQPRAVSPKVARAAAASSRRTGVGYSPTAGNDAFGARSRVSGNSYANGSSQNTGNVITDRSSTRVAQQPGGNSSFSLGWGSSEPQARQSTGRRQVPQPQQQSPFGYSQQPQQQQQPTMQSHGGYGSPAPYGNSGPGGGGRSGGGGSGVAFGANPDRMRGSSNAFANGASQNTGNYISDRSSTRIHAPPGGRSSLTFG